ncbi:MAG: hypothetical protein R3F11_13130 [Verrucomicrobiales bacterium]
MSLRHQIPFVRSAILAASTAVAGMAGAQTLDTLEKYGNASTGAFTADGSGGYTITSNGTDLWGNSDNASFLHGGTTSGDFSAVVRQLGVDQIRSEWGEPGLLPAPPLRRIRLTKVISARTQVKLMGQLSSTAIPMLETPLASGAAELVHRFSREIAYKFSRQTIFPSGCP